MDNVIPYGQRWTATCSSLVAVIVLSFLGMAVFKTWLKNDGYSRILHHEIKDDSTDESESNNDNGTSIRASVQRRGSNTASFEHGDSGEEEDDDDDDDSSSEAEELWREELESWAFSPPKRQPELLVSFCALGFQLWTSFLLVLFLSVAGLPASSIKLAGGGGTGGAFVWLLKAFAATYAVVAPSIGYFTFQMTHVLLGNPSTAAVEVELTHFEKIRTTEESSVVENVAKDILSEQNEQDFSAPASIQMISLPLLKKFDLKEALRVLVLQVAFPLSFVLLLVLFNIFDLIGAPSKRFFVSYPPLSLVLLAIYVLCILSPLLLLGYFVGFVKNSTKSSVGGGSLVGEVVGEHNHSTQDGGDDAPTSTPPPQPRSTHFIFSRICGTITSGLFSYVICHNEFHNILMATFYKYKYDEFGLLLVVLAVSAIAGGGFIMLSTYCRFYYEDFDWWWSSFLMTGSAALFGYLYALSFFSVQLGLLQSGFWIYWLSVTWICAAWFLAAGALGVASSFMFVHLLHQSIKMAR